MIGSLCMLLAMAAFAVEDALVKAVAVVLPIGQVLILFGLIGAMVFALVAVVRSEQLFSRAVLSQPMRYRFLFEITGRLFYFLAVTLTSLSSATVILQATPIVVVAGAAILFGERVGLARWAAILLGLIGVFIVVKPGASSFSVLSLLAVIGMLGLAGRDLASRAAPASLTTAVLGFYGFLAVAVAGGLYSMWDAKSFLGLSVNAMILLLCAIAAGVIAYAALMMAMRTGEVSAVTPFRYSRMLFGIALGVLVFGEKLSNSMIVGSGLIMLAGLYILWPRQVVEL